MNYEQLAAKAKVLVEKFGGNVDITVTTGDSVAEYDPITGEFVPLAQNLTTVVTGVVTSNRLGEHLKPDALINDSVKVLLAGDVNVLVGSTLQINGVSYRVLSVSTLTPDNTTNIITKVIAIK